MQKAVNESKKLVGAIIENRFLLTEVIGVGGLSTVFLAEHTKADLRVAVKVLHSYISDSEESIERFKREAAIINHLNHPNIVHVLSFGVLENAVEKADGSSMELDIQRPYLVLEHLEGEGLDKVLERERQMDEKEAYRIVCGVLKGLEEAHELGIVHRDVKPSNVMLTSESSSFDRDYPLEHFQAIKLLDFGIAKCNKVHDEDRKSLTQPGFVFGSPLYMSPEQCMGRELDSLTDIYSFGCMYYRMLAGVAPFEGESAMHTFAMHLYETARPIGEVREGLAAGVAPIIERCLLKDKAKRFQSARDLMKALHAVYE